MAKTRLCSRDEWELQETLEALRDRVQEIGVSGDAYIVVSSDGNITANAGIDDTCMLEMKVSNDGDCVSRKYKYGDFTR